MQQTRLADLGGKKVWKVTDSVALAMGEMKMEMTEIVFLAPDLSLLEGKSDSSETGKQKSHSFRRGEGGIELPRVPRGVAVAVMLCGMALCRPRHPV